MSLLFPLHLAVAASDILWGGLQFLLVTGAALLVLALVVSYLRFERMAALTAKDSKGPLGVRQAFLVQVADKISRTGPEDAGLVVMVMEAKPITHADHMVAAREGLIRHVRRSDRVMPLDGERIGLILVGGRSHAVEVAERLTRRAENEYGVPFRAGLATLPENGFRAAGLADAAEQVLGTLKAGNEEACWALAPVSESGAAQETRSDVRPDEDRHAERAIDTLTGVMRPDLLDTTLQKYVARQRKDMLPASVLYMAIDRFETYVEHYGAKSTDTLRRGVADLLDKAVRATDILGRYGEQTFVAALDCNWNEALTAAERLSSLVKTSVLEAGTNTVKATVSCGVAGYPDHGRTADRLLEAARTAGVVATERGRGLCLVYDRSMRRALTVDGLIDTL